MFYCFIALFGQSTCSDFSPDWFAVCGLVKKWSHFEKVLPGPRCSSKQEKLVAQQKLGPHAAEVEKYVTFFKSCRTVASTFTLPLLDLCGFVVIYLSIFACVVCFFNSACSAPSALVLEFNIHPSDLRLHLAAGSHISTGNTATVLFFVIEGFLPYGGGGTGSSQCSKSVYRGPCQHSWITRQC